MKAFCRLETEMSEAEPWPIQGIKEFPDSICPSRSSPAQLHAQDGLGSPGQPLGDAHI